MGRCETVAGFIIEEPGQETRSARSCLPFLWIGQFLLDAVPQGSIDDGFVLARPGLALMLNIAGIDGVGEQPIEMAAGERLSPCLASSAPPSGRNQAQLIGPLLEPPHRSHLEIKP